MPRWRREAANLLDGRRVSLLLPALGALVLLLFPVYSGDTYWMREITLIFVLTLVVSGVNLSFGYAGEVQFGQVFILALSAYVTMILAIHGLNEVVPLLIIGAAVALVVGVVIAVPALRIGGWSLAMASFFLVITLPDFVAIARKWTGGRDGLIGIPTPHLFGHVLGNDGLYWTTAVVALGWLLLYRNLVTSRYGVTFRVLRHSSTLSESLGFSTLGLKTLAYSLGAMPAGIAGCLYGYISLTITPGSFGLNLAIGVLAASVLGGVESVYGAILGAAILQKGPEESLSFAEYAPLAYGLFLVIAAVVLRGGISGLTTKLLRWTSRRIAPVSTRHVVDDATASDDQLRAWSQRTAARPSARLVVDGVTKTYGGVQALRGVTLAAEPGRITALIGSNGSGKTTLLNVICGYATASSGTVRLEDDTISGRSPARVARMGVGRTFQTPAVPAGVSVLDAVAAGGFQLERCGVLACVLRLPRYHRSRRATLARAHSYLKIVGLDHLANEEASSLALGTRRLVEVARALCADPKLLLLDEPASGLSATEVDRLGAIIRLAAEGGTTVVLIEHNFKFVTDIADTTHVLHLGELIASGTTAEVGRNQRVIESYLGESAAIAEGDELEPFAPARQVSVEQGQPDASPCLVLTEAVSGYGDLRVIDGVDLELRPGRVEVVLGRNGVGKTTLLSTIAGQVPLWHGALTVAGASVVRRKSYRRAGAGIALVQEGKRVFRRRTVAQNLMIGTHSLRVPNRERAEICRQLVKQFPMLETRLSDRAGSLSGGQQQMLAIAQALAARPRVLLLDEPSAGLAPAIVDELFVTVRKLADDGLAVLLVEQLAERALRIADHVTVLDAGRIVASGPPAQFEDRESLQQIYFGSAATMSEPTVSHR